MTVRTRFAPSPTGFLHIGGLRTAAYAYALAKHHHGQFLLRIEDTDQKREVAGATLALQTTLQKFGLLWDELHIQSQRAQKGIYQQAAHALVSKGFAFYCQCPARNTETQGYSNILRDPCRDKDLSSGAVKLKVPPHRTVSFHDFVHHKDISWDTDTVYDATLLKSNGLPTYHLAVAVDDLDMQITHILRGHDWLPSTPIHLLLFQYLGGHWPEIGHLTDILSGQTGKKLSKRRDSVFVESFVEQGYLLEAILNFVILLGWAPKDNRELFLLKDFVAAFDINGFQNANPHFFINKLDWLNGHYLRQKSDTELTHLVKSFVKINLPDTQIAQIVPLVKDRMTKLQEFDSLASFFLHPPHYSPDLWPDPALSLIHLEFAKEHFDALSQARFTDNLKAQGWKVGDFFMSLRIAICGSRTTPPLAQVMTLLGKSESNLRIASAISYLKKP